MQFTFYSNFTFEEWDYTNPHSVGIGGSETSHIEMATRLAARGHDVVSYAPVPFPDSHVYKDVRWESFRNADFSREGIWVFYRCPEELDKIEPSAKQRLWLICQDNHYEGWTEERAEKLEKVIILSLTHVPYLLKHWPFLGKKLFLSSNGIDVSLHKELEKANIPRNPKRLIYTSSPDRGLFALLPIFERAREWEPDLELHIFYGFDNMDKVIAQDCPAGRDAKDIKERILSKVKTMKNVFWYGRRNQTDITKEFLKSGIWCYPTDFHETSCITCMEAQSLGAIPVTVPLGALGSNVLHGISIEGNCLEDSTQAEFAHAVVDVVRNREYWDSVRSTMMWDARLKFNWERYVDQWEAWALDVPEEFVYHTQWAYQIKHSVGAILNIGCGDDGANLRGMGAVNLDAREANPQGLQNAPHITGDARKLPKEVYGLFDTVVLGDILEHMTFWDRVTSLREAKKALRNGGYIVVTLPSDNRTPEDRKAMAVAPSGTDEYIEGISAHHIYVDRDEMENMVAAAGLSASRWQPIDYTYFTGWGFCAS